VLVLAEGDAEVVSVAELLGAAELLLADGSVLVVSAAAEPTNTLVISAAADSEASESLVTREGVRNIIS